MHSEADYVYRPFRVVWFTMAITDRSAFNLLLANAALCLDQMKKPDSFEYGKCRESLTYYGACVAQVIQRLGDKDESASEGVIATVLGLICHDVSSPTQQDFKFADCYFCSCISILRTDWLFTLPVWSI